MPKVASFVCYLLPPLIKCCEFPRCDPFFEIILKLSYFGYLDMLPYIHSKLHLILRPWYDFFCFLQPSRVKSLVREMVADHLIISLVKMSQYCAMISSATSQQECIFVLHICLRQSFSENILLYQIWFISSVFMLTICKNSRDIN